jgi:hypothetical protein
VLQLLGLVSSGLVRRMAARILGGGAFNLKDMEKS